MVTTSVVNQGLGAQPGRDLLIADDTGTIANQIVALLQDADLASRVAQAGRAFVTSRFSWDAVSQRMQVVEQQVRQTRTETSR